MKTCRALPAKEETAHINFWSPAVGTSVCKILSALTLLCKLFALPFRVPMADKHS